jgi:nucleoside-diphosphate-sugar epimerase
VTAGYREFYRGRKVMITGGLGFIGSNLARQLVELDADVLLVDSVIPDYAATCSTKFKQTTSWSPTVSLSGGLRQTVAFYRAHLVEYTGDSTAPPARV